MEQCLEDARETRETSSEEDLAHRVAEGDAEEHGTGDGTHPAERFTAQKWLLSRFVGLVLIFGWVL